MSSVLFQPDQEKLTHFSQTSNITFSEDPALPVHSYVFALPVVLWMPRDKYDDMLIPASSTMPAMSCF